MLNNGYLQEDLCVGVYDKDKYIDTAGEIDILLVDLVT